MDMSDFPAPADGFVITNFLVVSELGLLNSLWGVIWPAVATPTGVFLLRQYMLTIPDELLDAARMDHASEWRIFWRIVLPLSAPALAVLAIFSAMWRWNDFLWPLIVLSRTENRAQRPRPRDPRLHPRSRRAPDRGRRSEALTRVRRQRIPRGPARALPAERRESGRPGSSAWRRGSPDSASWPSPA